LQNSTQESEIDELCILSRMKRHMNWVGMLHQYALLEIRMKHIKSGQNDSNCKSLHDVQEEGLQSPTSFLSELVVAVLEQF
jgi:hypothetical protein